MGRRASCSKEGLNRGAWSVDEDRILYDYITTHGGGKWGVLPRRAGLRRCGKSCRLRWLNYLRPGIKRCNFTEDEEDLIIRLHKLLGNRWSLIAGRLPGRTDNDIKNYWNTKLKKKVKEHNDDPQEAESPSTKQSSVNASLGTSNSHSMIRTKAKKFTKASFLPQKLAQITKENDPSGAEEGAPQPSLEDQDPWNYFMDLDGGEILQSSSQDSDYMNFLDRRMLENGVVMSGAWLSSSHSSPFKEDTFESWGITQLLALDVLDSQ